MEAPDRLEGIRDKGSKVGFYLNFKGHNSEYRQTVAEL